MQEIKELLANNRRWAEEQVKQDPDYFNRLAEQQAPEYLWIGCSDSRVPANQIVGMAPGEVFVHRNVGNQVIQTDFNCLAVIEFAVLKLKVKHILVVGHYGCGGVRASMESSRHGIVDHWLQPIKEIYRENNKELNDLPYDDRFNKMCELNVIQQVENLSKNHIVQQAWDNGQELSIHGWCYSVRDGLVRDLDVTVLGKEDLDPIFQYDSGDS